jgi:hypothetical protein
MRSLARDACTVARDRLEARRQRAIEAVSWTLGIDLRS